MVAKNDITGDLIKTKGRYSKQGEDNFEKIFGKKKEIVIDEDDWDEARMDIIGQNGALGLHYFNNEGNDNERS